MLLLLFFSSLALALEPSGRTYWEDVAREDLEESLKVEMNLGTAKNVIIFVGDGMGPNTITAARIYKNGESSYLSWERFPHFGAIKTYAADKQVSDSATTATAMFTGVKNNFNTLGVDETVEHEDCEASLSAGTHLRSITTDAQEAGKATGIVTTTRVTHATPGAMYAHSASRNWECDTAKPANTTKCKDIARQLIEDLPGKNLNVILGGGHYMMTTSENGIFAGEDELETYCLRADGRNLISDWAEDKLTKNLAYAVVNDTESLMSVQTSKTEYLLGIFANSHMPLEHEREKTVPSLSDMTTTAIKVLNNNKNGFLLMVESGLIDLAHHIGKAHKAIHEVLSLQDAVNATIHLLETIGILDETLVIVTSDHSHTLTISGYPERGNNILDIAGVGFDGVPYTTLGYANAGKDNYHYSVIDDQVVRLDPSKVDTRSFDYGVQAGVLQDMNTHGGSDVFVYAKGPYAHLFHHIHEQNYIATVIRYAAKIGEYSNRG